MDQTQLETFLAIAEHKSYSKAAEHIKCHPTYSNCKNKKFGK